MIRRNLIDPEGQSGAALIIVLLLVATMSFIALAISENTVLSARRSHNARSRGEVLWLGFGAENLARAAIRSALENTQTGMTADSPLFAAPREFPIEGGDLVMSFADRTRCFNINSLVAADNDGQSALNKPAAEELQKLMDAFRAPGGEAMIAAIVDWIDADSLQQPRGAEDDHYASLPTPYRTGAAPLADISELRAIAGVDRERYRLLASRLCAYPDNAPTHINVNMLGESDAPLLSALTGGQLSVDEAADVIRNRPPGGYPNADSFWQAKAFEGKQISDAMRERVKLTSQFIEAYAVINYGGTTANLSMLFEASENGSPRLIVRRLERFD